MLRQDEIRAYKEALRIKKLVDEYVCCFGDTEEQTIKNFKAFGIRNPRIADLFLTEDDRLNLPPTKKLMEVLL